MKNLIKRLKRQAQAYIDFRAQPAADINLKLTKSSQPSKKHKKSN